MPGVRAVSVGLRPLRSLSKCQVATLTLCGLAAVTVAVVDPLTEFRLAEIVVVPAAAPVARPDVLMLATVALEEAQVAVELTSPVELSL